ncbi:hypothetical protein [Methylophaga sp. SB9B]|nr:hypothetical protein [Methylophaga sp. SB9B]
MFIKYLSKNLFIVISVLLSSASATPTTFEQSKIIAKEQIYFDRNDDGSTYCSCQWKWVGKSGGRVDFKSCGYKIRAEGQRNRAQRIE